MPITKQAAKKLDRDEKRTRQNNKVRLNLKNLIRSMRQKPAKKTLVTVYQALDKAAKKKVIHLNKAARLKARLAKLLTKK